MCEKLPPGVTDAELTMVNTLFVKPDLWFAYRAALLEILPQARALDACLMLEVGEVVGQPGTVMLTERWRSGAEYVNDITQLPMYQKYLSASESMYERPRIVVVLTPI